MSLQAHVVKILAIRVLVAALVLLGLLQILDLIDVTTDILARNLGVGGVIYYATLRLPRFDEQVAPLHTISRTDPSTVRTRRSARRLTASSWVTTASVSPSRWRMRRAGKCRGRFMRVRAERRARGGMR